MNYSKLKDEIKNIADIASSLPEAFQNKCFEILLENLLAEICTDKSSTSSTKPKDEKDEVDPVKSPNQSLPISAKIQVFMRTTEVTNEDLDALFLYDGNDLHFIKEPIVRTVSTGQIEWALLIALKNGILKGSMSCDAESVRSICQEKGYYDRKNFSSIFKKPANAKLFNSPLEPQGSARTLSTDGNTALGKLVKTLVGTSA